MGKISLAWGGWGSYVRSPWPKGALCPTGHLLDWGYVMNALAQLGMVSVIPSENQSTDASFPMFEGEERTDYFVEKDGMKFAGTHLLVDLWGASNLDSPSHIDQALRHGAVVAGAALSRWARRSPRSSIQTSYRVHRAVGSGWSKGYKQGTTLWVEEGT